MERPTRFRTQQFVSPGRWAKEIQLRRQLKTQQRLKHEAAEETKTFLSELSKQRKQIKEYEREGYDVKETDEGLKFSKQVKRIVQSRVTSRARKVRAIKVHWKNREGKAVVTATHADRIEAVTKEIHEKHGGYVFKVTTHEAAPHMKSETVWETKEEPVYKYVTVPSEGKVVGDVTVRHIGMDKTIDLGFGDRVIEDSDKKVKVFVPSVSQSEKFREISKASYVSQQAKYDKFIKYKKEIQESFSFKKGDPGKASVKFLGSFALSAPAYFVSLPSVISGERTALDIYASVSASTEKEAKKGGIEGVLGVIKQSYTDPMGTGRFFTEIAATSYAMGAGVGALKKTAWGARTLVRSKGVWESARHGKVFTKLFKPSVGKPIWQLSRSQAVEAGIAGYYSKDIPKQVVEHPYETGISLAISLPLVGTFYKAGHRYGGGLVDRLHGMSKVTGLDRIRQKGLYETFDILDTSPIKSPKYKTDPFDLTQVQRIGHEGALQVTGFIKSEWGRRSRPSIGGALSLDIMGIPRRKMPYVLKKWSEGQIKKAKTYVAERKTRSYDAATKDIDIMVKDVLNVGRDELGYLGIQSSLKRAELIKSPHKIDIWRGGYKPGSELGFGLREMKRVKGYVYDPWLSKVKITPEVMEWGGYTYEVLPEIRGAKLSRAEMVASGTRFDMPDIRISTQFLQKYPSYVKGKGAYWASPPIEKGRAYGIPGEVSGKSIILHELGHHEFPLTSAGRGRISTGIVERLNVLLERKIFRDPKMLSAIDTFIKTGKWKYPGKKMGTLVLDPLEQFGRTGEAMLPSNVEIKGYRMAKDPGRWWNVGQAIIEKNKHISKKLSRSMDKVVHPDLYKSEMPPVPFGERFVKRIGGGVEQKPVWMISVDRKGRLKAYIDFKYPKSTYPTRIFKPVMGFKYPSAPSPKKYPSAKLPFYKTPVHHPYKPSIVPPYKTPSKPPPIIPPRIIPPIVPLPNKYPPDKPPPHSPPIIMYGKEITLPKPPTFKFKEPTVTKRKKKTKDVLPGRRKISKGTLRFEAPRYRFRKFDIGQLFKGVKI